MQAREGIRRLWGQDCKIRPLTDAGSSLVRPTRTVDMRNRAVEVLVMYLG